MGARIKKLGPWARINIRWGLKLVCACDDPLGREGGRDSAARPPRSSPRGPESVSPSSHSEALVRWKEGHLEGLADGHGSEHSERRHAEGCVQQTALVCSSP